jgi:hypothetical protein
MKILNAEAATVPRKKIVDYLLELSHPDNKGKAAFFFRFGFTVDDWKSFADALVKHLVENDVAEKKENAYAVKYVVVGRLSTPDGRNPIIASVWKVQGEGAYPEFVTAHPTMKGEIQ